MLSVPEAYFSKNRIPFSCENAGAFIILLLCRATKIARDKSNLHVAHPNILEYRFTRYIIVYKNAGTCIPIYYNVYCPNTGRTRTSRYMSTKIQYLVYNASKLGLIIKTSVTPQPCTMYS